MKNIFKNISQDDIQDSWASLESIIDYYGNNQDYSMKSAIYESLQDFIQFYFEFTVIPNAGAGHWNDPDMLIIGNFGLSYEQSKTQMGNLFLIF